MELNNGQPEPKSAKYYNYLKENGADVPPDYDSFVRNLSDPEKAKKYHKYVLSKELDAPSDYDKWAKTLELGEYALKKKDDTLFPDPSTFVAAKPQAGTMDSEIISDPVQQSQQGPPSEDKLALPEPSFNPAALEEGIKRFQSNIAKSPEQMRHEMALANQDKASLRSFIAGEKYLTPQQEADRMDVMKNMGKTAWNVMAYQMPSAAAAVTTFFPERDPHERAITSETQQAVKEREVMAEQGRKRAVEFSIKLQQKGAKLTENTINSLDKIQDPWDAVLWAVNAATQAGIQIPATVATAGGSSFIQEVGSIYVDGIQKIAQEKNITIQEVMDQNLDEPLTALVFGLSAAALDKIGADKVLEPFTKGAIRNSLRSRAAQVIGAGTVEGTTEYFQTWLEQVGSLHGAKDSYSKAITEAWKNGEFKKERLEALAQGAVGGSALSGITPSKINQQENAKTTRTGPSGQGSEQKVEPGKEERIRVRDTEKDGMETGTQEKVSTDKEKVDDSGIKEQPIAQGQGGEGPVDTGAVKQKPEGEGVAESVGKVDKTDDGIRKTYGDIGVALVKQYEQNLGEEFVDRQRVIEQADRIQKVDNIGPESQAIAEALQYEVGYGDGFKDLKSAIEKGGMEINAPNVKRMIDVGVKLPEDIVKKYEAYVQENKTTQPDSGGKPAVPKAKKEKALQAPEAEAPKKKRPTLRENVAKKYGAIKDVSPRTIIQKYFATGGFINHEEAKNRTGYGEKDLRGWTKAGGKSYDDIIQMVREQMNVEEVQDQDAIIREIDDVIMGGKKNLFVELRDKLSKEGLAEGKKEYRVVDEFYDDKGKFDNQYFLENAKEDPDAVRDLLGLDFTEFNELMKDAEEEQKIIMAEKQSDDFWNSLSETDKDEIYEGQQRAFAEDDSGPVVGKPDTGAKKPSGETKAGKSGEGGTKTSGQKGEVGFDYDKLFEKANQVTEEERKVNAENEKKQRQEKAFQDLKWDKKYASTRDEAISKTVKKYADAKVEFDDWSSRQYKENKGEVFVGPGELEGGTFTIDQINEGRKKKKLQALRYEMDEAIGMFEELGVQKQDYESLVDAELKKRKPAAKKEASPKDVNPKIAEKEKKLDELFKKFGQQLGKRGTIQTGVDPEAIATGLEIVKTYTEIGVLKFADMIKHMIKKYGADVAREYFDGMKAAYGAYVTTSQDDLVDDMDDNKTVRKAEVEEIIKTVTDEKQEQKQTEEKTTAKTETDKGDSRLRDRSGQEPGGAVGDNRGGGTALQIEGKRPGLVYATKEGMPIPKTHLNDADYTALDEHQRLGVNMILDAFDRGKKAFLLGDSVGVGKTAQLIASAVELSKKGKVLLISENKQILEGNFANDAKLLGVDIKANKNIEMGTYDDIRTGKAGNGEYVAAIYDEAHNRKNVESGKSKAADNVKTQYEVFATATPMDNPHGAVYFIAKVTNQPEENVYKQLGFTVTKTKDQFGNVVKKVNISSGTSPSTIKANIISMRDDIIRSGQMLRREYPFYGSLESAAFQLGQNQVDEQNEIDSYWDDQLADAENENGVVPPKKRMSIEGQRSGERSRWNEYQKLPFVYAEVKKELAAGRKVVIIAEGINTTFIKGLNRSIPGFIGELVMKLEADGIKIAKIFGDNNKTAEIKDFQDGDVMVAIGTPKSASTGINLDDTVGDKPRTMIMVTPNYSGNIFQQILGRVSRRNTASPAKAVMVYNNSSSDLRRKEIVDKKLAVLRAIQEGKLDADMDMGGLETEADPDKPIMAYVKDLNASQFIVLGDTKPIKDRLSSFGGRWNPKLKGWVFNKSNITNTRSVFDTTKPLIQTVQEYLESVQGKSPQAQFALNRLDGRSPKQVEIASKRISKVGLQKLVKVLASKFKLFNEPAKVVTDLATLKKDWEEYKRTGGIIFLQDLENKIPVVRYTLSALEKIPQFKDMKGRMVKPVSITQLLGKPGIKQIEKDIINDVLSSDDFKTDKISYDAFLEAVSARVMSLDKLRTETYATYGKSNLGREEVYGNEEDTVILNAPVEHGVKGHFTNDFYVEPKEWNIQEVTTPAGVTTYIAVDKNKPANITPEQMMNYVGTAGSKEAVERWVKIYKDRVENKQGKANIGLFGHFRGWFNESKRQYFIAEMQSDFYQKQKASEALLPEYEISTQELREARSQSWKDVFKIMEDYGVNITPPQRSGLEQPPSMYNIDLELKYAIGSRMPENKGFTDQQRVKEFDDAKTKIEKLVEQYRLLYDKIKKEENAKRLKPEEKQFIAYTKGYEKRIIDEALKEAALKGASTAYIPHPYTLSVIEGYVDPTGEGAVPYEVISRNNTRSDDLEVGDVIDYGGTTMIVVEADSWNIKVAPKDSVNRFNINDYIEEETQYRWDNDVFYEMEQRVEDVHAITKEEIKSLDADGIFGFNTLIERLKEDAESLEDGETLDIDSYEDDIKELFADDLREYNNLEDIYGRNNVFYEDGSDYVTTITEGTHVESFSQPDQYEQDSAVDIESFNDKVAAKDFSNDQQTVIDKYTEINEQIKKDFPEAVEYEDENGMPWIEIPLSEQDAYKPIVAFRQQQNNQALPNGFIYKDRVYINPDTARMDTPIHEFGHLWVVAMKHSEQYKPLYKAMAAAVKNSVYYQDVKNNPSYAGLTEAEIIDEALAMGIGERGALIADQPLWKRLWKQFTDFIKTVLKIKKPIDLNNFTINDFLDIAANELLSPGEIGYLNSVHLPETIGFRLKRYKMPKDAWAAWKTRVIAEQIIGKNRDAWVHTVLGSKAQMWHEVLAGLQDKTHFMALIQNDIVNHFQSLAIGKVNDDTTLSDKEKKKAIAYIKENKPALKEAVLGDQFDIHGQMDVGQGKVAYQYENIKKIFFGTPPAETGYGDLFRFLTLHTDIKGRVLMDKQSIGYKLGEVGLNLLDLGTYMAAKHIPKRNAEFFVKNENNIQYQTGVTDAQAAEILKAYESNPKALEVLKEAEKIFRENVIKKNLDIQLENGMLTQEQYDNLLNAYDGTYVPWKVSTKSHGDKAGRYTGNVGKGVYSSIKKLTPRGEKYGFDDRINPFVSGIQQLEKTIANAEKNRLLNNLAGLIKSNPDKSVWEVKHIAYEAQTDLATGEVSFKILNMSKKDADALEKEGFRFFDDTGKPKYVVIHDENLRKAISLSGDNGAVSGPGRILMNLMANAMNYLRFTQTAANVDFIASNLVRDLQDAGINLQAYETKGLARRVLKLVPTSSATILKHELGKLDPSSKMGQWLDEMKREGGEISWLASEGVDKITDDIYDEVQAFNASKTKSVAGSLLWPVRSTLRGVMLANKVVEQQIRFATYVALREKGVSPQKAALAAKNVTVNFNKMGAWKGFRLAYMYLNPSIQGMSTQLTTLAKSKLARKAVLAITVSMLANRFLLEALADDDDELKEYLRTLNPKDHSQNLMLANPFSKSKFLKIPISYNLRPYKAIADGTFDAIKGNKTLPKIASYITSEFASSYIPMSEQYFIPTLALPVAEPLMNEVTFSGRPVYKESIGFKKKESESYFNSASPFSIEAARLMGNVFEETDDILEVHPDMIDYYSNWLMGGMRTYLTTPTEFAKEVFGDDKLNTVDINKIAIARRFILDVEKQDYRATVRFYELHKDLMTEREGASKSTTYDEFIKLSSQLIKNGQLASGEANRKAKEIRKQQEARFNKQLPKYRLKKDGSVTIIQVDTDDD